MPLYNARYEQEKYYARAQESTPAPVTFMVRMGCHTMKPVWREGITIQDCLDQLRWVVNINKACLVPWLIWPGGRWKRAYEGTEIPEGCDVFFQKLSGRQRI